MTQEQFLEALPEKVTIEGDHMHNEIYINGKKLPLEPSLKVWAHSPTGFNWGYGGSGPAQTALAILMRYVKAETAQK